MLNSIEDGLRVDDPVFAAKLTFTAAKRHFRRQTVLAHGFLWLGMFIAFTGFGLVDDVLGRVCCSFCTGSVCWDGDGRDCAVALAGRQISASSLVLAYTGSSNLLVRRLGG